MYLVCYMRLWLCVQAFYLLLWIPIVKCFPQNCRKAEGQINIHTNYIVVLCACNVRTRMPIQWFASPLSADVMRMRIRYSKCQSRTRRICAGE